MLQYDTYPAIDHVPSAGRQSHQALFLNPLGATALTSSCVLDYVILLPMAAPRTARFATSFDNRNSDTASDGRRHESPRPSSTSDGPGGRCTSTCLASSFLTASPPTLFVSFLPPITSSPSLRPALLLLRSTSIRGLGKRACIFPCRAIQAAS
jgi:hypothetical protein